MERPRSLSQLAPQRGIQHLKALVDVARPVSAMGTSPESRRFSGCDVFCDVATVPVDGHPLSRAACLGSLRLVRTLLEGGVDVNSRTADGQTALIVLCTRRPVNREEVDASLDMANLLIASGADVNIRDRFGKSALMYACAVGQSSRLVGLLLSKGADLFTEDRLGFTPLIYGYNGHDQAVIKALSDHCREQGREMVILETELNANFLSNLKVQRMVGASHSTVALGSKNGDGIPSQSINFARRLSAMSDKLATLIPRTDGGGKRPPTSGGNTLLGVDAAESANRTRSRSVGSILCGPIRKEKNETPTPPPMTMARPRLVPLAQSTNDETLVTVGALITLTPSDGLGEFCPYCHRSQSKTTRSDVAIQTLQ
uniref:Uncharacterized protein n=1 Tax=Plectus sambesii TaxID=2011161 RepID=A0A914UNZ6_9BILA